MVTLHKKFHSPNVYTPKSNMTRSSNHGSERNDDFFSLISAIICFMLESGFLKQTQVGKTDEQEKDVDS